MVRSNAAFPLTVALAAMLALSIFGAMAFSTGPARAQSSDVSALNDRIERLQRDIDVLQRQVARQGGSSRSSGGSAAATAAGGDVGFIDRTESRFEGIEQQLRDLTGRVEQLSFQINQLTSRMDKLVSDVDFRLNAVERGGTAPAAGAAPAPTAPPPAAAPSTQGSVGQPQVGAGQQRLVLVPGAPGAAPAPAPAPTPATAVAPELPQGSPEAQYEFAYGVLLQAQREQSDFGRAEQALRAFINANPTHRLAGNANYWLGETYYVRKDYQDAASTFAEGLQKYPKSDKAPDNLLKLGMSLGQLNRKPDACGALAELNKRFPNAAPQIKTTAQRERTRLGCT
jgi:tol-pal system protein YbgF